MAQTNRGQQRRPGGSRSSNGRGQDLERLEQQLANYLQSRIKPGLNRGSIPRLARSIAHDLAEVTQSNGASRSAQREEDDDALGAEDFEADMRDLQAELGEDWIVRFSVQGEDAWLTAEKEDGSQRLEAPTASVLVKVAKLLDRD